MPELVVYQAIWGLENLPISISARVCPRHRSCARSRVRWCRRRADKARTERSRLPSHRRSGQDLGGDRLRSHGLEDLARDVDRSQALGAHHLNVQILERLDRVSAAVALIKSMEAVAAQASIPVHYKTHRRPPTISACSPSGSSTRCRGLRLTGDLSHYPVVHECRCRLPEVDQRRIGRVLDQCWGFHGRVPGSHQVQISIETPQHPGWVDQLRKWWRQGFASWRGRAPADATLSFMAELGPPHYAMTDAPGANSPIAGARRKRSRNGARTVGGNLRPGRGRYSTLSSAGSSPAAPRRARSSTICSCPPRPMG